MLCIYISDTKLRDLYYKASQFLTHKFRPIVQGPIVVYNAWSDRSIILWPIDLFQSRIKWFLTDQWQGWNPLPVTDRLECSSLSSLKYPDRPLLPTDITQLMALEVAQRFDPFSGEWCRLFIAEGVGKYPTFWGKRGPTDSYACELGGLPTDSSGASRSWPSLLLPTVVGDYADRSSCYVSADRSSC